MLELYDLYADNVYKLAYSFIGNRADAEDVVQDVFFKLLRQDIRIRDGKEKSYLLKMTANTCKDMRKSTRVTAEVPYEDALDKETETSFTDDEYNLVNAISRLPQKYRMVIHLFYYEGYSVKEIARMLGISSSAITMRLTRGREQLKDMISKEDLHD